MAKFKVKITQVFKTARTIVVEVEADDLASAIEEIDSGALTGPSFDARTGRRVGTCRTKKWKLRSAINCKFVQLG